MRPIVVTAGPLVTASANNIATSQTLTSPSLTVTLNGSLVSGGVATLDKPRHISITSAGNDSGITFTITGTTYAGSAASEVLTGGNATAVTSVIDYATVTSIVASNSTASTITVGTSAVSGSEWVRFDEYSPSNISIQCNVTGTVNYTVQSTLDDPNSPTNPVTIANVNWVSSSDTNVVGASATKQSNFLFAPIFARILLNSGSGSVTATFVQDSNGPY